MKTMIEKETIEELSLKFKKKKKLIKIMIAECKEKSYNVSESRSLILEFFKIN